ncbi:hypothetical protein TNCT_519031 [Trichonephila clavata]|uniref:Uncharacterized protein n=1 Tax=Trichonephila clavata TaxID=2740835 RepID=A0A8X6FC52_TRICU|nr:hypothetical protein TNCT_519031 [Trichonephila clavata]
MESDERTLLKSPIPVESEETMCPSIPMESDETIETPHSHVEMTIQSFVKMESKVDMGLPKLSAEEARKESRRKWRMRPEAKQKKREVDKKCQTISRALGKSGECVKKYRSDPVKYERQMALQ